MPHLTVLEIPTELGIRVSRSTPTLVGHVPTAGVMVGSNPRPQPPPAPSPPISRPAPWTETVYISPSGRIFLPPGYAFADDQPSALTAHTIRREPAPPRPEPYRARVVIGQVAPVVARPRTVTRESWVVPAHLRAG
ncbi:hypothetical protein [Paraliomyxa miuraensis]|uniref:hypothetical protein n=1 Tax=Paraliomyxa miuraensis TaxID=376150 RepID=UPI00225BF95D|nr:hypothetical protein [Paraliomyxa miuraensis]MCX4243962.1 hypothetical protein [Paraliomyxa miuraensis]